MLRFLFLIVMVFLSFVSRATAQSEQATFVREELAPGFVRYVYIVVDDQVEGGCWTNSDAVTAQVRLSLERDGVAVLETPPAFYSPAVVVLRIYGLGLRANSGLCAGHYSLTFGRFGNERWGRVETKDAYSFNAWNEVWSRSSVFVAGSNNDQQFLELANQAMTEFLGDYFSAKRSDEVENFFADFPGLKDAPISRAKFEEMMESKK